MKPPPTILGGLMATPWMRRAATRRWMLGGAALIFAVFSLWPEQYLARADLMPQDSGNGLSALLTQSGGAGLAGLSALLGNHQSIEADLTMARSQAVLRAAIARMRLVGTQGYRDPGRAQVKIRNKLDIAAIRGSILQITARDGDPAFAKALVTAYVAAIQESLTALTLRQTAQRREVAENRLSQASARLAAAQAALGRFRSENKLAAPEQQLGVGVSQLAILQAQLQAKQVELQTLGEFATPANLRVQAVQAEIAGLRRQISLADTASHDQSGPTLAAMALQSAQYLNLYRDEKFAEALYAVYTRFLEQVTVDELSAGASMDVIEPPFVDPARQYNAPAVALLVLVLILAAVAEYYEARPPVGRVE